MDIMKRTVAVILFAVIPLMAFSQAQITTKKEKLKDFPYKITKVVLTGNAFKDQAIKEAVKNSWTISAFEFCDMKDFNAMKTNPELYFLLLSDIRQKKESRPGISVFTLVKGEPGVKDLNDMLEVASIPVSAADVPSGKEIAVMPALLDIMQEYVDKSLSSRFSGIGSVKGKLSSTADFRLIFDKEDLSPQIDDKYISDKFDNKMLLGEEDDIVEAMIYGSDDTAVGYVVAPAEPEPGSLCYTMLIDAMTHELYYFSKYKVSKNTNKGFLKRDIAKITGPRKSKR